MIKFEGTLSPKAREVYSNFMWKVHIKAGVFSALFVSAILIVFALRTEPLYFGLLAIPVLLMFLFFIKPGSKLYKKFGKSQYDEDTVWCIEIDENSLTFSFLNISEEKSLEDVKEVIDFGEWYQIFFYRKAVYYMCQKDLLVEGSLEEFEELFKDKLIRKISE